MAVKWAAEMPSAVAKSVSLAITSSSLSKISTHVVTRPIRSRTRAFTVHHLSGPSFRPDHRGRKASVQHSCGRSLALARKSPRTHPSQRVHIAYRLAPVSAVDLFVERSEGITASASRPRRRGRRPLAGEMLRRSAPILLAGAQLMALAMQRERFL